MNIMKELQQKLKAPKDSRNDFGGFNYRSAEGILEAVKPLLADLDAYLHITDDIVACGPWVYVKATATIVQNDKAISSASAFARETESKKGMDAAQITGAASSYARKYALNGLFGIDDTKDPDSNEYQADRAIDNKSHRFKKGEKEQYIIGLQDACTALDEIGAKELWHELERDAQLKIWPELSTTEQNFIKSILGDKE